MDNFLDYLQEDASSGGVLFQLIEYVKRLLGTINALRSELEDMKTLCDSYRNNLLAEREEHRNATYSLVSREEYDNMAGRARHYQAKSEEYYSCWLKDYAANIMKYLTPDVYMEIKGYMTTVRDTDGNIIHGSQKIEAIKFLRRATNFGLKESKDIIESVDWNPAQ